MQQCQEMSVILFCLYFELSMTLNTLKAVKASSLYIKGKKFNQVYKAEQVFK